MTAEAPSVSIVVPVRNGGGQLIDLIASLQALDYPKERLDVLVVDNGSTDGSAEAAESRGVRVIREERPGASHARNSGVAATRGSIVAFTDHDCVVTRGWIRGLVAAFADPGVGGAGGRTETYLPKTAVERHAVRTGHLDAEHHLAHPTFPFAPTANAAFRREIFERIGGFDPEFPWGEPVDFCKRAVRDAGTRIAFAPRAIVFHRARSSVAEFCRQQRGYGFSLALLCAKYRDEVVWDGARDRAATAEIVKAGLLTPVGCAEALLRMNREPLEHRALEFLRLVARRQGFRRAVRERSLVFNDGRGSR